MVRSNADGRLAGSCLCCAAVLALAGAAWTDQGSQTGERLVKGTMGTTFCKEAQAATPGRAGRERRLYGRRGATALTGERVTTVSAGWETTSRWRARPDRLQLRKRTESSTPTAAAQPDCEIVTALELRLQGLKTGSDQGRHGQLPLAGDTGRRSRI